ncbi:hypothetical protein PPERSA_02193 [Pseudocohnilembus persalinus]|uniref:Anoctamin transmembrane domain-containing protein n=1 Tax=Pseudocohnilembus persalinus TaxID=266149 RepID=A0A0V0R121_PSEPJ|nr:hypothetical protein PPERSA_02193 [Pseudocohnilembus persalinus]|eukprot:KRX08061.1 hypothetical protein PPERSA_02193 [Pseudocohnilembus persalinus]
MSDINTQLINQAKPPFDFALVYKKSTLNKELVFNSLKGFSFFGKFLDPPNSKNQTIFFIKNVNYTQLLKEAEKLRLEKEYHTPPPQFIQKSQKYINFKAVLQNLDPRVKKYEKFRRFRYSDKMGYLQGEKTKLLQESMNQLQIDEIIFKELFSKAEQIMIKYSILYSIKSDTDTQEIRLLEFQQNKFHLLDIVPLYDNDIIKDVYDKKQMKEYFGENISFYFEFVKFFQRLLVIPIIFGLLTELLDYIYDKEHKDSSPFESIYCIIVVLWAGAFYTLWKRKEYSIRYMYCSGSKNFIFSQKFHNYNPERVCKKMDKVTGEIQNYYPKMQRYVQYLKAYIISLPFIIITLAFLVASLNIRGLVDEEFSILYIKAFADMGKDNGIFGKKYFGSFFNLLHVIVIANINAVFLKVVYWTTKSECHDSEYDYQNSIINKRYIFEFFSYFSDLFYIAFIQFDILALKDQLISLYSVDEIRRITTETVIPLMRKHKLEQIYIITKRFIIYHFPSLFKKQIEEENKSAQKAQTEDEYFLEKLDEIKRPKYDSFGDYIEIIMNFSYLTLFASAFTFAPILIFFFNMIEYMSDKFKLVHNYQRPLPKKAKGIGSWNHVLNFMCIMSVFTNIILFAFSSEQIVEFFPYFFQTQEGVLGSVFNMVKDTKFVQGIANSINQSQTHIDFGSGDHDLGNFNILQATPKTGQGRYVVAILFGIEHALFLGIWVIRKLIQQRKQWVDYLKERRIYQGKIIGIQGQLLNDQNENSEQQQNQTQQSEQ